MERLTMRNSDGSVSQPMGTTVEEVFYRLADYEDTGLTPEQVMRMMKTMREVGMELMRMEKLMRLDRSRWEECVVCNKCGVGGSNELLCNGGEANYCPLCGRPLTEQAWAELEKRVYGDSPAAAARRETQMIKPLEHDFCVEDETGRTDAKIVEKINEIIKALNEITERKQENGYG